MNIRIWAAASLLAVVGSTSAASYSPNYVWQRWLDWTPGAVAGSTAGAIDDDLNGGAAWRYGYLSGGAFDSANPWYSQNSQLAVWDDEWWGSNVGGVWARNYFGPGATNDNANPPIDRYTMWHDVSASTHSYAYTSAIDWLNPVGDGAILNISGKLTFQWFGHFSDDSPLVPIEGVVVKYDASTDSFQTLWSGRVTNPTVGSAFSALSTVEVPITFVGVRFDEGDYLRFTLRADTPESQVPMWLGMRDGMYMRLVSVVPEPSIASMLLVGLAAVGLRCRRRSARQ